MPSLPPVTSEDHAVGPADAEVVIVEYGDFQCPYCVQLEPVMYDLRARFVDRVQFVFREFPLAEIHPFAEGAAVAAEAAAEQGRFWEMHDLLFARSPALNATELTAYAKELGLDITRFAAAQHDPAIRWRISKTIEGAVQAGVQGTPSLFLNGSPFEDEPTLDALTKTIGGLLAVL
jgi:protein-disulfide isomerase